MTEEYLIRYTCKGCNHTWHEVHSWACDSKECPECFNKFVSADSSCKLTRLIESYSKLPLIVKVC